MRWRSLTLDCGTIEKAGKVSLTATTDDTGFRRFEFVAFGQTHRLSEDDIKKLREFPLDSLLVTHEAGYPQLGGHTVYFRFRRTFYDADKKFRKQEITVSVDETHKVTMVGSQDKN